MLQLPQGPRGLLRPGGVSPVPPSKLAVPNGLVGYWPLSADTTDFQQGVTFDVSGNGNLTAPKRVVSLSALARTFSIKINQMPFIGEFSAVDAGEQISLSADFSNWIASGDSIARCAGSVAVYQGADANAANLAQGAAVSSGNVVSQWVGSAFVPGVVYRWYASITTAKGNEFAAFGHLPCASAAAPSALSVVWTPLGNNIDVYASQAVTVPGVYRLWTTGITLTLPTSWSYAQGIIIKDMTDASNPGQILSGVIDGHTAASPYTFTTPYQAVILAWSAKLGGFTAS